MGRYSPLGRCSAPRSCLSPTTLDLAWASGFLEGEGSFKHNGNKHPSEQVQATQVQRQPLDKLAQLFGGSLTLCPPQRVGQQAQWKWGVSGSRARGMMMTLFFFMSPKRRRQIKEALNACRD